MTLRHPALLNTANTLRRTDTTCTSIDAVGHVAGEHCASGSACVCPHRESQHVATRRATNSSLAARSSLSPALHYYTFNRGEDVVQMTMIFVSAAPFQSETCRYRSILCVPSAIRLASSVVARCEATHALGRHLGGTVP